MDYSFENLKRLYDSYGIGKDKTTQKFVVYEKGTNNVFDFDSELANRVKFAHTWVFATKFGESSFSPQVDGAELNPLEYERAFNENSRATYELIMEMAIMGLQAFGRMYRPEAFKRELKSSMPYKHTDDIVDGLFAKPNGYVSFELWCRKAAGLDLIENDTIHR